MSLIASSSPNDLNNLTTDPNWFVDVTEAELTSGRSFLTDEEIEAETAELIEDIADREYHASGNW
jgi:hypothetical protein